MLLIYILRYFAGSVKIAVYDGFIERFLNLASRAGINFWGVKIKKDGSLELWMRASMFKQLRPIVRKTGVCVHIIEKRGLPFKVHRYRHRVGIVLGVVIFSLIMFLLSSIIWVIKVEGNVTVSDEQIIEKLSELGFKTGVFKWNVDLETIHNTMLLDIPKLSWISINIKGSTAVVAVREREDKPDIIKEGSPSNIVALHDGQIVDIIVYQGQSVVKVGDAVKKGQLLVSGVMDSAHGARFVEAKASVKARIWRDITKTQPFKIEKQVLTGNISTKKKLRLGDALINLYLDSSIPFEKYGIIKKTKPIINFPPFIISLETIEYHEVENSVESIDREKALQLATNAAKAEIDKLGALEILSEKRDIKEDQNGVTVNVKIEYTADIGKSVPLDFQG